jgi:predicted transcriptional regulator
MAEDVFRPGRSGAAAVLGSLESQIMEVVWRRPDPVSVTMVHQALIADGRALSYSAVKAVLNNLADKGRLAKTRAGKATYFQAAQSRDAFEADVVAAVVGSLKRNFGAPAIAHLVNELAVDEESLVEFERLVAQRRAELNR